MLLTVLVEVCGAMRKGHRSAVSLLYSLVGEGGLRLQEAVSTAQFDIYFLVGEGGLRLTRSGFNRPVRSPIFKTDLTLYHVGAIAHNT